MSATLTHCARVPFGQARDVANEVRIEINNTAGSIVFFVKDKPHPLMLKGIVEASWPLHVFMYSTSRGRAAVAIIASQSRQVDWLRRDETTMLTHIEVPAGGYMHLSTPPRQSKSEDDTGWNSAWTVDIDVQFETTGDMDSCAKLDSTLTAVCFPLPRLSFLHCATSPSLPQD